MSNEIAMIEQDVEDFLNKSEKNLEQYKLREYNTRGFIKSAQLCIVDNRDLQACMKTKEGKISLYHALMFAASTGLSLNPQEQKACLVPYNGKIKYQIQKGGMVELALDSGTIKKIYADTVRENDSFEITKKTQGDEYISKPALVNRGGIKGFFASLTTIDGDSHVLFMTNEEMIEHKNKYGRGINKPDSAWNKSFKGMGEKTVIKALLRKINISAPVSAMIGHDEQIVPEKKIVGETEIIKDTPQKEAKPKPEKKTEKIAPKSGDLDKPLF